MIEIVSPQQTCAKHPEVAGPYACVYCRKSFCVECCYSMPEGSIVCHDCYAQTQAPAPVAAAVPANPVRVTPTLRISTVSEAPRAHEEIVLPGQGCLQHPNVQGYHTCSFCGARSCLTCDFYFPNGTHACPVCASASSGRLSPNRKKYMTWSLITGGMATVVTAIFFSGILAHMNKMQAFVMAEVLFRLILFPAAIGAGLAIAAFRKGRSNSIGIWLGLIWNLVLMIGILGAAVIGLFAKEA